MFNLTRKDFVPPVIVKLLNRFFFKNKVLKQTEIYVKSKVLKSFSQYNEDLMIDVILKCKKSGFYVDVGANHPENLSNTKRFYDRGWTGINIEPNPKLIELFKKNRSRDINLNIGIDKESGILPFYVMASDAGSSFDKQVAIDTGKPYGSEIVEVLDIPVLPLERVFSEHLNGREIDFMSIDTEGFDLRVLASNDWKRFRPSLILVETVFDAKREMHNFLTDKDYLLVFDNDTNSIYLDQNRISEICQD